MNTRKKTAETEEKEIGGPVSLTAIRRMNRPFIGKIETEAGTVQFKGTFNPRVYTPAYTEMMKGADSSDPNIWAYLLAGSKPPLLSSWEVCYGEEDAEPGYAWNGEEIAAICSPEEVGKPVPIEQERLAKLPIELLIATIDAIGDSASPKPTTGDSEKEPSTSSFRTDEPGAVLKNTDFTGHHDT
jgi:hypothetical protein